MAASHSEADAPTVAALLVRRLCETARLLGNNSDDVPLSFFGVPGDYRRVASATRCRRTALKSCAQPLLTHNADIVHVASAYVTQ